MTPNQPIYPSNDELHDRITEDALVLELMELLRECETFLKRALIIGDEDKERRADLVKRIEEVLK